MLISVKRKILHDYRRKFNERFKVLSLIMRLYDVNIKKKLFSISVSFINFFIAILCYNLSFHDVFRSPVCNTCKAIIITCTKLRV